MVVCQSAACTGRTRESPRRTPIANARQQKPIANYLPVTDRWQTVIDSAPATLWEKQKKARAPRVPFLQSAGVAA
jgi:hypothetical protein